jgi:hypothetical protein
MKKYRDGKIKQEHQIIPGLRPLLEQVERCPAVRSIIPGPIRPLNAKPSLTFQYFTETGLKLLARNGSAIQEVFLTAHEREAALAWLEQEGLVERQVPEPGPAPANGSAPLVTERLPYEAACHACGKPMRAGSRVVRRGRKNSYFVHVRCAKP